MAISFDRIPDNIRVPLFWAEISTRDAASFTQNQVALLFGPKLAAGIAVPLEPVLVGSSDDAIGLFGVGSILSDMVSVYRRNDNYRTLWCIPHVDPVGGTAASISQDVVGTATAPGSIYGYIAGARVVANVASGDTAVIVAGKIVAAVNADPFLPVTAAVDATDAFTYVLTCKHLGLIGNDIDVSLNLRGVAGGEFLPPGITITSDSGFMTGGVGVAPLQAVVDAMASDEYDYVGSPYNTPADLDVLRDLMADTGVGRWAWDQQIYGHVFTATPGTYAGLQTAGVARNDPHTHNIGYPENNASPAWRRAAALTAQAAVALSIDPARPLQTLPLVGCLAPARGKGFKVNEKNTLLYSGIAQEMYDLDGTVRIQRCISMYQRNVWGQRDDSWLDIQSAATVMYFVRYMRARMLQKFPRHKLADDGTPFGPGQAVATPAIIRGELIAAYEELVAEGVVENVEAYKRDLIVERNANDPNRVDVFAPPDLINQLRVLAMMVAFRLQSPATTAAAA